MIVERDPGFNSKSVLFWICGVMAGAVFLVGLLALAVPVPGSASFGVPVMDAANAPAVAWTRLMGVRDVALALMLFALMALRVPRIAGLLLLLVVIVPVVDCATVIHATGFTYHIFVHGGTAMLMVVTGWLLLRR